MPGQWRRRRNFIDRITGGVPQPKLRVYTRIAGPPQQCNRSRGLHLYVHSKMAVIDDELLIVGSANCNNRGWETDSELAVASFEDAAPGAVTTAKRLRTSLWAEHGLDLFGWVRKQPPDPSAILCEIGFLSTSSPHPVPVGQAFQPDG